MTSHALKSFWKCYHQLPAHVQKLADKNFALFKANPWHPSLGFAKKGAVYTVEVGRSYRALARERNGNYYWFWIGTHEEYNKFHCSVLLFAPGCSRKRPTTTRARRSPATAGRTRIKSQLRKGASLPRSFAL